MIYLNSLDKYITNHKEKLRFIVLMQIVIFGSPMIWEYYEQLHSKQRVRCPTNYVDPKHLTEMNRPQLWSC